MGEVIKVTFPERYACRRTLTSVSSQAMWQNFKCRVSRISQQTTNTEQLLIVLSRFELITETSMNANKPPAASANMSIIDSGYFLFMSDIIFLVYSLFANVNGSWFYTDTISLFNCMTTNVSSLDDGISDSCMVWKRNSNIINLLENIEQWEWKKGWWKCKGISLA